MMIRLNGQLKANLKHFKQYYGLNPGARFKPASI